MSEVKVEDGVKIEHKGASRRKLIQKVKRKVKKEQEQLAETYKQLAAQPRSGLGAFMGNNPHDECDFDMSNQITMGQSRKLKKKMKKLQKKMGEHPDRIFKEIQKYKQGLYQGHQKKIFSPVNEMQKRREQRKKKMEQNSKKRKSQILQKNLERFE